MAERPVFIVLEAFPFVKTETVEFVYYPGFSMKQMRKSIRSLHDSFVQRCPEYSGLVLEISSKSETPPGVRLSAFNLLYTLSDGRKRTVESIFQSGKCFENGRQYTELLDMPSAEAKRFEALHTSGGVVRFRLENEWFPAKPLRFFYQWLYVNALHQNPDLADEVMRYRAFTDIAFNPRKSLNCQAGAAALYAALRASGNLEEALRSPESFLAVVYHDKE